MSGNPAGGVDALGHRWNRLEAQAVEMEERSGGGSGGDGDVFRRSCLIVEVLDRNPHFLILSWNLSWIQSWKQILVRILPDSLCSLGSPPWLGGSGRLEWVLESGKAAGVVWRQGPIQGVGCRVGREGNDWVSILSTQILIYRMFLFAPGVGKMLNEFFP